jgi:hypothetical protein
MHRRDDQIGFRVGTSDWDSEDRDTPVGAATLAQVLRRAVHPQPVCRCKLVYGIPYSCQAQSPAPTIHTHIHAHAHDAIIVASSGVEFTVPSSCSQDIKGGMPGPCPSVSHAWVPKWGITECCCPLIQVPCEVVVAAEQAALLHLRHTHTPRHTHDHQLRLNDRR